MCRSGVMSWEMPSSAMIWVTVDGVEFGNDLVTDSCEPISSELMVVRCASVRPFMMTCIPPNQNAGTGRRRNPAKSPASSKVSSNVTTSGVSCLPNSATDSATMA